MWKAWDDKPTTPVWPVLHCAVVLQKSDVFSFTLEEPFSTWINRNIRGDWTVIRQSKNTSNSGGSVPETWWRPNQPKRLRRCTEMCLAALTMKSESISNNNWNVGRPIYICFISRTTNTAFNIRFKGGNEKKKINKYKKINKNLQIISKFQY